MEQNEYTPNNISHPFPWEDFPDPVDDFPDPDDERLFPRLSPAQLEQVARFAERQRFERGDVLFEHGEREIPFFVLEEGTVDFLDPRPDEDIYFARAKAGTFIGDTAVFTGEPSIATCLAATDCQVLRMGRQALRELITHHSSIGDLVLRTMMARRAWMNEHDYGTIQLIGSRWSQNTFRLRDFMSRNQVPFRWLDPDEDEESQLLLDEFQVTPDEMPVIVAGSQIFRQPSVEEIADAMGLRPPLRSSDEPPYDLIVVGAGPAGLAAAVYGASEGLTTLALDADSPGGQAGTSSKIENYLGFATGISGGELARQAVLQARKFGAVLTNPRRATSLTCTVQHVDGEAHADAPQREYIKTVTLEDGSQVQGHAVVLAVGAEYRKLSAEGIERFEGSGVYYAAGTSEAQQCRDEEVIIVGGGNSAGQAAVFMAEHARRVYLVVRSAPLTKSMSQYLVDRVESSASVDILLDAEVTAIHGDDRLEAVTVTGPDGDRRIDASAVFVMIGAVPRTDWLVGSGLVLDENSFIPTGGSALKQHDGEAASWPLEREPYFLETSHPGVFAVGDVRAGSIKRVASAVGEGSMAVKLVHEVLASSEAHVSA